jgi:DNA polymerase-4
MRGEGYVGRTVTLKLRDHRFQTLTRQRALSSHTADGTVFFETARRLFREHWKGGPVRLLGISVSSLGRGKDELQQSLFDPDERSLRLREALDRVRDRLGEASVVPLGSLRHRRTLGHVPFGSVRGPGVTRRTPGRSRP